MWGGTGTTINVGGTPIPFTDIKIEVGFRGTES